MADKEFSEDDYMAGLELNTRGTALVNPRDRAMRAAQKMSSQLRQALHGDTNSLVTDAMRSRGVNVGFDEPAGPMDAVEKMKNGLARNTGKTKKQLFGGK